MIRRDYILRMIEEFIQVLSRLQALKRGEQWDAAEGELDSEFQRLVDAGAAEAARLSETELLAKVMRGEPTQVVRHKTMMLATLLSEAGDVATARDKIDEGRQCYLKALHLLLDTLGRGDVFEFPEFVPKIDGLLAALGDAPLPIQTQARLMEHFEQTGAFAKAEDALFAMLDAEPGNAAVVEFGLAFYRRLLTRSDAALAEGNLPRPEIEQSMKDLQERSTR